MRTVYVVLHYILVTAYVVAPMVAVLRSARLRRTTGNGSAGYATLGTFVAGATMGVAISVVYAVAVKGTVSISQAMLAAYFATSLLLLLKAFDGMLKTAVWRACVRRRIDEAGEPVVVVRRGRAAVGNLIRVVVLFGVGLPFVMSAIVTYRPKVLPNDDPLSQLGFPFERVTFRATDGVRIAGWWIPGNLDARRMLSDRTVIICHGLGANKSNQLILARRLVPAGYNVLAIDLRAHGESGGQLSSFGDLERRDVLGAVRWLREDRPQTARRIYGVGASLGAAALIGAAADDSPEGRAIEALAVYGTYDDLQRLVTVLSRRTFLPPVSWIVDWLALPFASMHVGADLSRFRPAELVEKLWPRPILVIHGVQDQIIDFAHGQRLFDRAFQPKQFLWLERGDHNSIINSDDAADAVRRFFDTARAVQVI